MSQLSLEERAHHREDAKARIRKIFELLGWKSAGAVSLLESPPIDDLDSRRRVSVRIPIVTEEGKRDALCYLGASIYLHRYPPFLGPQEAEGLVRGATWSVLFSFRPERKFLALATDVWALSPDEPSFERALLRFRLKQLEDKITDYGEYSPWEVVRQLPRALLRTLPFGSKR